MSAPDEVPAFSKDHPFPARLTDNRLLTKPGSAKETRHFAVNITGSGLHYKAGDSLGVFPTNRPSDVDALIHALGATGDEPVLLPKATAPIALREAFTSRVALAAPTRKIVDTLAAKVTDPEEKARLLGLLTPESKDVLAAYLREREFADLISEYPSARLTPQEAVDHMRKLMPRLYSIASSPKVHPQEVHLTVAIVRYQTNGRSRVGVCSSYLADRAEAGEARTPVFVSHSHFGLPEDGSKDVIMVGPGTGIAPFRAFVQDRISSGAAGRNWVFFGDQHRRTDFLYEEEWNAWLADGRIARLDTAFSRDQLLKIYVQDRMREAASELWSWIQGGAHFYVCGDATRMAKDVETALHDIISDQGGMTPHAAVDYVKQMKKDKRYQKDVY